MHAPMRTERRDAYRVAVSGDDAIGAEVIGKSGRAAGEVADLSLKGAAIRFPLAQDPTFGVGALVTVLLDCGQDEVVEVEATVQTRTELNDARRFGFTFADSRALRVKLNAGLLELFNQRKAFRVEPSATVPVTVRIRVDELEITGRLRDISTDGVGVLMDATAEDQLSHVLDVNLVLHLPDGGAPLRVKASIRNRTRTDKKNRICYGLRFDPASSSSPSEDHQRLVAYVMLRQRELLQARRR